jgi:hypothetical protein
VNEYRGSAITLRTLECNVYCFWLPRSYGEGSLAALVHALPSEGGPLPAALANACQVVNDTSVEDIIGEEPHARGKHIIDKCKRAAWPWIASTMRLKQNFLQYNEMKESFDVQSLWNSWSKIVNFRRRRALKKPPAFVQALIYTLEDLPVFSHPAFALADRGDSDVEVPAVKGDGVNVPDDAPLLDLLTSNVERSLLSEYLNTVIQPLSYVTVPAPSTHEDEIRCFQVLKKKSKNVLVKTFSSGNSDKTRWLVQLLDVWRGADVKLGQDRIRTLQ